MAYKAAIHPGQMSCCHAAFCSGKPPTLSEAARQALRNDVAKSVVLARDGL